MEATRWESSLSPAPTVLRQRPSLFSQATALLIDGALPSLGPFYGPRRVFYVTLFFSGGPFDSLSRVFPILLAPFFRIGYHCLHKNLPPKTFPLCGSVQEGRDQTTLFLFSCSVPTKQRCTSEPHAACPFYQLTLFGPVFPLLQWPLLSRTGSFTDDKPMGPRAALRPLTLFRPSSSVGSETTAPFPQPQPKNNRGGSPAHADFPHQVGVLHLFSF